jgi:hypothetical protein
VTRAQEGTTGHTVSAAYWVHGPTAIDFPLGPDQLTGNQVQAGIAAFDLGAR